MAEEKKVMDVAKPGSAKPDTGSKPMVIGHKSMAADPSVKIDTLDAEENISEKKSAPAKKIRLKPISESIKEDANTDDETEPDESAVDTKTLETETESTLKTEEKSEEITEADGDSSGTKPTEKKPEVDNPKDESPEEKEATKEEKQEKVDSEQVEREERLQQLIKSREYNVQIKQSHNFGIKTFTLTFLIVLVLGMAALAALVDAEILDLGIDLPFDLL